jgi:tetratricopeptide (TPR) repeat protein
VTRLSAKFWTVSPKLWAAFSKLWAVSLAILVIGGVDAAGLLCRSASGEESNTASKESWSSSFTSSVKRGFNKIGQALDPKGSSAKAVPEDDAIALKNQGKPSPELYVAIARRSEEIGNQADAEQQYQAALRINADHLPALLGYARLKEQLGLANEAVALYRQAAKSHPREPSVHNNIGLFYARQGRLDDAVAAMTVAVQLAPKNPLYRNNIATVLVDQCRFREAYSHLRSVFSEASAYYNMGYLLNKKGQTQAAMQNFALALRADPSMAPAQRWIEHLQKTTTQARLPHHPAAEGLRITSERPQPNATRDSGLVGSSRNEVEQAPAPRNLARPPMANNVERAPMPSNVERAPTPNDVARAPELTAGPDRGASSLLPEAAGPRRLPPIPSGQAESDGPSLPGISYDRSEPAPQPPTPTAPLPPPSTNSAVQRLPRVR